MTRAIVTYAHRPKRPPRKRKAVALDVPAIVRSGKREASKPATLPAPANDVWAPAPRPPRAKTSAIVTITRRRGHKPPAELEDDPVADARVKAFFARMMRPPGS